MKPRISALAALALAFVTQAYSQTLKVTPTPQQAPSAPAAPAESAAPTAPAAPLVPAEANDTARFLAGLAPAAASPLSSLAAQDPQWVQHAKFFDTAWADLDKNQLSKIRAWDAAYNSAASTSNTPVYYMFSGPDYLYVDSFFPNASTYVLCGIEPVGTMPDITKIKPEALGAELQDLQTSLNSVLNFSFFITKDMKTDLQNHEINGTLPIILIFIARANNTINDVSFVGIDSGGKIHPVENPAKSHESLIPGVKITYTQPNSAAPQTVYYFDTDISDDGIKHTPGFLKYCQSLAPGNSFVKSASYLMHESYFSTIRSFLLKNSLTLVQDDSGIPISYFTPKEWMVRYFGSYPGPIDLFKKYFQQELFNTYQKSHPIPLDFRFGYRHYAAQSSLILATKKGAEVPVPAPASSPAPANAVVVPASTPATTDPLITPLTPPGPQP